MVKVVQINSCIYGSTGVIMRELQDAILKSGNKGITCSSKDWSKRHIEIENHIYAGSIVEKRISRLLEYYTGREGHYLWLGTYRLLKRLKQFQPDIVHLHNLHGSKINLKMLFSYLKENPQIKVIWTLHDCWGFTGHCPYFDQIECNQWKDGCTKCEQFFLYPASRCDNARLMYTQKKELFSNVNNMTIVTPSQWLANLVRESFLGQYPIRVIHNGIDQNIFKPTDSNIRKKYGLKRKFVLLGVAAAWGERKGFYEIMKLSKTLPDNMQIVLVGAQTEKIEAANGRFIYIHQTDSREELAQLYSAADVFINPTLEDNYPTVNLEALSCGTPVITYNTGGSGESVFSGCGIVVQKGDVEALRDAVFQIHKMPLCANKILQYRDFFEKERMIRNYMKLYEE